MVPRPSCPRAPTAVPEFVPPRSDRRKACSAQPLEPRVRRAGLRQRPTPRTTRTFRPASSVPDVSHQKIAVRRACRCRGADCDAAAATACGKRSNRLRDALRRPRAVSEHSSGFGFSLRNDWVIDRPPRSVCRADSPCYPSRLRQVETRDDQVVDPYERDDHVALSRCLTSRCAAVPSPKLVRAPEAVFEPVPPRLIGAWLDGLFASAHETIRASMSALLRRCSTAARRKRSDGLSNPERRPETCSGYGASLSLGLRDRAWERGDRQVIERLRDLLDRIIGGGQVPVEPARYETYLGTDKPVVIRSALRAPTRRALPRRPDATMTLRVPSGQHQDCRSCPTRGKPDVGLLRCRRADGNASRR